METENLTKCFLTLSICSEVVINYINSTDPALCYEKYRFKRKENTDVRLLLWNIAVNDSASLLRTPRAHLLECTGMQQ